VRIAHLALRLFQKWQYLRFFPCNLSRCRLTTSPVSIFIRTLCQFEDPEDFIVLLTQRRQVKVKISSFREPVALGAKLSFGYQTDFTLHEKLDTLVTPQRF
jgi:hypothetical protein